MTAAILCKYSAHYLIATLNKVSRKKPITIASTNAIYRFLLFVNHCLLRLLYQMP